MGHLLKRLSMELRCLTCDIQLERSFANDLSQPVPECKSFIMAKIYEDCLQMEASGNDVICDGCKVQLILFYQFKLKVVAIQLRRLEEYVKKKDGLEDAEPPLEDQEKNNEDAPTQSSIVKKSNEYNCSHCSATFLIRSALKAHIIGLHSNHESFVCTDCNNPFNSYQELKDHKRAIHTSKSFVCHFCGSHFNKASKLRFHIKSKHEKTVNAAEPKLKMIACNICQKILSNKSALRRHKAAVHNMGGINLSYTCQICDTHWPSNASLQTHHLTKHTSERNFKCAVCEKGFATKPLLVSHINRVHCCTKDFICDTCGKSFKTQAYLNTHYLVHSKKKTFICPDCGASYRQEATLYSHMKSHREKTAGIRYDCQICQTTFANARTLKKHEMSHTGPDLHCDYCNKKYKQKDSLTKHTLSVHNRIRFRVACILCGKTLWNRKIMRSHVQDEHGDELRSDPEKTVDDYLENTKIYDNNVKTEKSGLHIISVQILNV